jgi:hypothetical protein
MFTKPLSLLFFISPLSCLSYAQSGSPADSAFYHSALGNTINYFYANSKSVCTCLNGKEYIAPSFSFSEGSPFFLAAEAKDGTLVYDHVFYDGVHLLYDELQNNLVFVDENHRIMLLNEKVERFSILGHQFVNIEQQEPINEDHPTGYFQILYEGKSVMLKKEEKTIRELNSFSAEEKVRVIDTRSVYYLKRGNHYFKIDGEKSFFEVWGNYQKEIAAFIKHNKIKLKKELDIDYARITAFCDELSPQFTLPVK